MSATFDQVRAVAEAMGLTPQYDAVTGRLTVGREADDWSLPRTLIAIGTEGIHDRALATLATLKPQLQRELDAVVKDEKDTRLEIAAGIASDGTINPLRVERDGTVRLSPADIKAIAAEVVAQLSVSS